MADETTASSLVEEWKKICYEFSIESKDLLIPVISKVFDACDALAKNLDQSRIQLALKLLESKLYLCLSEESHSDRLSVSDELSIRTLMYDLIKASHAILLYTTSSTDSTSSEDRERLVEMVKGWKRKCSDFSRHSDDILIPVLLEVYDVFDAILTESDHSRVLFTFKSLDIARSACESAEPTDVPHIRTLIYGAIHCLQRCLIDIISLNDKISSEGKHNHEITDPDDMNCLMQMIKEEESMDDGEELKEVDQKSENGFSTIPNSTAPQAVPKAESIDPKEEISEDNHMLDDFDFHLGKDNSRIAVNGEETSEIDHAEMPILTSELAMSLIEEPEVTPDNNKTDRRKGENSSTKGSNEKEGVEDTMKLVDLPKDASDNITTRKRSSRSSKSIKYVESDRDSEEDRKPAMKKMKSESESGKAKKSHKDKVSEVKSKKGRKRVSKVNETELECPKCKFRTRSVNSWDNHLSRKHSTTPSQVKAREARHVTKATPVKRGRPAAGKAVKKVSFTPKKTATPKKVASAKRGRPVKATTPKVCKAVRDRSTVASSRSVDVHAEHYSMFTDPTPLPEKRVRKSLHPNMKL